jgi:hypothetical protein
VFAVHGFLHRELGFNIKVVSRLCAVRHKRIHTKQEENEELGPNTIGSTKIESHASPSINLTSLTKIKRQKNAYISYKRK